MTTTGSDAAMRRPVHFTPQPHKPAPRTTSTATLNRSMQSLTLVHRRSSEVNFPPTSSSSHDKENRSSRGLHLPSTVESAMRHTPVKVYPAFLSPSSASSASIRSSFSSLSPSSSASASSTLVVVSPRHPLSLRSPNVPSSVPRMSAAVEQPKAKAAQKFQKPTSFHTRAKRTSPPAPAQPLPRVRKPTPSTFRPQANPSAAAAVSQPQPRAVGHPSSSSPRLRSQLQSLQSALGEEREKVKALTAEVGRLRAELAEERMRGGAEETDEVMGRYWHPVAHWDVYAAVNSEASSASEADDSDGEEEEEEQEDGEAQAEAEVSAAASYSDHGEAEDDEDDSGDEPDEDSDSRVDSASTCSALSPMRWKRHSTSTADDELAHRMALATLSPTAPMVVVSEVSIRQAGSSIEDAHHTRREAAEDDEANGDEADADDSSHRSASASSALSAATSSCSLSSSPNFHDVFPYERNLYLLSRRYHFLHRLYTCPDAVTFKALHIHSGAPVVIKISEGFSPSRSHPKEVRLLTRAQGHPNVMTLRGWYGLEPTKCYAFITDWVPNVGIEQVWDDVDDRRQYLHDLLLGLSHLHARGILYRDVKPSNVLWDEAQRRAVIIDFDVATYFDRRHLHRSVVGTTGFMAPEMTRLDEVSQDGGVGGVDGYGQEVDVYSCGVLFGQLLFRIHEDEVADAARPETKGPAMVERVLSWAHAHGGRIGAEYHLLLRMLTADPPLRISVHDALQHPYFTQKSSA